MTVEPRTQFTLEDYRHLPEDDRRHEIIGGEHVVTPAPIPRHQYVVSRFDRVVGTFVDDNGLGRLYTSPIDVILSDTDVVQPDLLFIASGRLEIIGDAAIEGAPDLVVEVLSESTRARDEVYKRRLYERFGVGEYLVADPELRSVKVFRTGDDGLYRRVAELTVEADDELTSPLFPGLAVPLSSLFE